MGTDGLPELFQLTRSHYNEKARWGLDFKKIPHRRTTVLPGLQRRAMKKLTGQTQVPVVRLGDRYVSGSAAILAALEELQPRPELFPADPVLREEAVALQAHFDANVGTLTRRGVFSFLLDDSEFFSRVFGEHLGFVQQKLLQGLIAAVRSKVKQEVGLDGPASVEEAYEGTRRALDLVVEKSRATGYLVGDRFTVADLTAAALLALTVDVGHPAMRLPEPWSEPYVAWLAHWKSHPGTDWVCSIYERHRGVSAAV